MNNRLATAANTLKNRAHVFNRVSALPEKEHLAIYGACESIRLAAMDADRESNVNRIVSALDVIRAHMCAPHVARVMAAAADVLNCVMYEMESAA